MPVRANKYFNDPSLGQGFSNLAELFKPPSGQETYAFARAKAAQEEAARLKDLYDYSNAPDYNQGLAERRSIAAGRYTPNQSFQAIDLNNQNAVKLKGMENTNALERERLSQEGQTTRTSMGPLSQDQVRYTPPAVAQKLGVEPQQFGIVSAKPGEVYRLPGTTGAPGAGPTMNGIEPKLTTDQLRAQQLQQRSAANPNDPAVEQAILGPIATTNTTTPDGAGKVQTTAEAVRQGAAPYNAPSTTQPKTSMAQRPDGSQTPVVYDPVQGWVDSQTRQPLPTGSKIFDLKAQGTPGELGVGTQGTVDKGLLDIAQASNTLGRYRTLVSNSPGVQGLVGKLQGTLQNVIQAGGEVSQLLGEQQQAVQALSAAGKFAPEVMQKFQNFRGDIPAAEALRQMLIAQVAAATSNDRQVSNKDLERVELQIGGGSFWSNQADTMARLEQVQKDLEARGGILRQAGTAGAKLFSGTPQAAPAPSSTPVMRWGRDANGNPVQLPAGP